MRYYLIIFLLPFLISCSGNDSNSLPLFNGYSFSIGKGEMKTKVNYISNDAYVKYFNKDSLVQVPLFYCLKQNFNQIFIGLPVTKNINQLIPKSDSLLQYSESLIDSNSVFQKYKQDKYFLTRYITRLDTSAVLAVYVLSEDSVQWTAFSKEALKNRIVKE
jgi:hypothetical protein